MILVRETCAAGINVGLNTFKIFQIIGDDRATFAGGNQLAGLETEGPKVAHGASAFTVPLPAVRVRAIFHNFEMVFFCDTQNLIHVCKTHSQVNRKDGFGFWSYRAFDLFCVKTVGVWVDVDKYRNSIHQQDRTYGAFPGVRRNDYFITGPNVDGFQGGLYRYRSSVNALPVFRSVGRGKFLCESARIFTGKRLAAPPGALQHILKGAPLFFFPERPNWKRSSSNRIAAGNCEFSHTASLQVISKFMLCQDSATKRLARWH
jgi:hypothetical protein